VNLHPRKTGVRKRTGARASTMRTRLLDWMFTFIKDGDDADPVLKNENTNLLLRGQEPVVKTHFLNRRHSSPSRRGRHSSSPLLVLALHQRSKYSSFFADSHSVVRRRG
jgi:hypothetical protein